MLNIRALEKFCSNLTIDSKEKGLTPLTLYGTQRYFLNEVCRLNSEGVHFIYCLKARQQGISTICLALDLFWMFTHPGLQGTLVCDTDENRQNFKSILEGYNNSLPRSLRVPIKLHNRNILEYKNRSKLLYQVAGTRIKGQRNTLGQAKGINYVHGTELSSWGDPEATANFIASLAESFPHRLYLFESTAKGYNDFQQRWKDAKNAISQGNIFIGWWRMESYSAPRDSDVFKIYGDFPPSGEEKLWMDAVEDQYDYKISKEQLAWWRWKLAEEIRDERLMFQFYPPTEDHAFQESGYRFFNLERLAETAKECRMKNPEYYRYKIDATFDMTEIYPCNEHMAQLTVWEQPDPNGYYVVAADPAYGSSHESDNYCIQVFRCWTNRIEQVAEYCTPEGNCYSFAWIIAHLCGAYRHKLMPSIMVLEINGPGRTVMDEFQRLQIHPQHLGTHSANAKGLHDVIASISNYLYTRQDSLAGSFNYHWKTTADLKEYVMNMMRDAYDSGQLIIVSEDLCEEMRYIQQDKGTIGSATRTVKDDRVIATALGIEGWKRMLLPELYEMQHTFEQWQLAKPVAGEHPNVLAYRLQGFFRQFRDDVEQ